MLQQFTWQQFLIAALIFNLVWYIVIVLLHFRKELEILFDRLKGRPEPPYERIRHPWENELEEDAPDDLMGKSVMPEGVSRVDTSDFSFISQEKQEALKETQLGLIPDVMEELKKIFSILQKEDGNKTDFFSLLELVKVKYPQIGADPNIDYLNDFIKEHVPFLLTKEELNNIWD